MCVCVCACMYVCGGEGECMHACMLVCVDYKVQSTISGLVLFVFGIPGWGGGLYVERGRSPAY